jgi:O-antigen ligase
MNQSPFHDWFQSPDYRPLDNILATPERNWLELWLAVAVVALAPVNLLRADAFYFTASDAIAVLVFPLMILNRSLPVSPLGPGTMLWNFGLATMIALLLTSGLLYGDVIRSLTVCGQYLFAYFLLSYVVVPRPRDDIALMMKALVYSIAVMCLYGIYVVDVVGERFTTFVSGSGRFLGFVERENECAALIALSVPLLLWLGFSRKLPPYAVTVLLILDVYAIMLTGSNTGLFAIVYAVACFLSIAVTWRQGVLALACASLLFVSLTTWGRDFTPAIFQTRVLGALETGDIEEAGTFSGRVDLIDEAIDLAENSTVLGIGADSYREVSRYGAPVHNTYLLLWVESGFFGMIGFIVMLLGGLVLGIATFRRPGGRIDGICALTSVSLFALMLNAFPHMYGRFFVVPILLAMAPGAGLVRHARQ